MVSKEKSIVTHRKYEHLRSIEVWKQMILSFLRTLVKYLRLTRQPFWFQLLRKLSFSNTSSPSTSPTYHDTSQKCCHRKLYVQQINRTPNRCKIAPSPDHYTSNANAFASKSSLNKECRNSYILDDFHHSNSIVNNTNNKSQRNNSSNNLSRIFRIRQSTLSKQAKNKSKHACGLVSSSATTAKCKNDDCLNSHDMHNNNSNNLNNNNINNNKNNNNNSSSNCSKQSIECSMATISPISSSISSSAVSPSPLIFEDEEIIFTENQIYIGINEHHHHHHHHRHLGNNGGRCKNATNLNERWCECEATQKYHEKSTFDLVTGNLFNSKRPNSTYRTNGVCGDVHSDHEHVFEKVGIDKSKKPSPFTSPMGNECFFDGNSNSTSGNISGNHKGNIDGPSVNYSGTSSKSKQQITRHHFLFDSNLDLSYDDGLKCTFDHEVDNSPTKRLSEYDNLNETFCLSHATCSKQNSSNRSKYLAENNDSGYGNGTYAETWDFLNSRPIHTPSTPSSTTASTTNTRPLSKKLYEIHYETAVSGSSRRTSISTIETWIEDEVFDNSFNEELEKRCASLSASPYH